MQGDSSFCERRKLYNSRDKSYDIILYLQYVDFRHGCRDTAQIVDGMFVHCREHNHEPDLRQVERREIKASLKRGAGTTSEPLRVVYEQEVNKRSGGIVDVTYRELERTMTKRRKTVQKCVPQTLNEFINELRDEPIYFGQVKSGDEYGLISASIEASNVLDSSEEVHVDATFKVVPRRFHQLLVIYRVQDGTVLPCVFILMTAKRRLLYTESFKFVKTMTRTQPKTIVTDFEVALQHSLPFISADAVLRGCFFHFSQAVFPKTQKIGLVSYASSYKEPKLWLRMFMCLALLPSDLIISSYQSRLHPSKLPEQHGNHSAVVQLCENFEKYWVNPIGPKRFSVFEAKRRTNAAVESFNRSISNRFRINHMNPWTFRDRIKMINQTNDSEIAQSRNGSEFRRPKRPKRRYNVTIERRVKAAETLFVYGTLNVDEFLTKASFQIQQLIFKRQYVTDEDHDIPNSSVLPVTRRIETWTQYRNDEFGPSDRVLPNEGFDDNSEHANSSTDEASDGDDFVGGLSRTSIASAIMNSRR